MILLFHCYKFIPGVDFFFEDERKRGDGEEGINRIVGCKNK